MELRAHDILKLVDVAREWYDAGKPYMGVPAPVGHVSCSLRMVVVHEVPSQGLQVLVTGREGEGGSQSGLPVCLLSHEGGGVVTNAIQKTLKVQTSPPY